MGAKKSIKDTKKWNQKSNIEDFMSASLLGIGSITGLIVFIPANIVTVVLYILQILK
jgi:hypothetical protein